MILKGKRALILGVANNRSIAYGIAEAFKAEGARLAFNYVGDAIKKRVEPISEEFGGEFIFPCDVCDDAQVAEAVKFVQEQWGQVDILVHSIAFANREDLQGQYMDVSRDGFKLAMEISAFSLPCLCNAFAPIMAENGSVLTMTYNGSQRVLPGYNVMGVAKAALEASVRYLAYDLGAKGIRVNSISAGPIKTLAASAVSSLKYIFEHIEDVAPLHRNVTPTDVGATAVYLASDYSRAVTGQNIFVDSGYNVMGI